MPTSQMSEFIQHLRRAVLLRDEAGLSDGQLMEDYISRSNEAAFAALVRRHGPMVWGVCRRVLDSYHDAEDAFQATFLVFVRKAASIASSELLANWLYGVAHQTAFNARVTAAKRRARERQVMDMPEPEVVQQHRWHDLQPLLDQELSHLPDKYRVPIVLCDLQGKTRKEAAQQLACPEGTVAGRLARARIMLAKRLARHGVVLSGGALAAVLSQNAALAGVPTSVVSSTLKAASLYAAGGLAATAGISAQVAALMEGVLRTMLLTKLKITTALILAVSLAATGTSVLIYPPALAQEPAAVSNPRQAGVEQQARAEQKDEAPLSTSRGDAQNTGRFNGRGAKGVKKWEFDSGAPHQSSVAIARDGTIYLGANDKKLYALHAATGAKKWEFETGEEVVVSSPAIGNDGTVYVGSSDQKLYALGGASGRKKWTFQTGAEVHGSPTIVVDGTVFIGSNDCKVYALNAVTGVKRWEFATGGSVCHRPALSSDGRTLYVASDDGKVYAVDAKTGAHKWASSLGGAVCSCPAVSSDGTVYVSAGHLHALDGATGEKKWHFATHNSDALNCSPALAADGTVYVRAGPKTLKRDNEVVELKGKLFAVDGATGASKWEFEMAGDADGFSCFSSPVIDADGTVYAASGTKLHAVNGKTGTKKWDVELEGAIYAAPTIGPDGTIYLGTVAGKVYAIR